MLGSPLLGRAELSPHLLGDASTVSSAWIAIARASARCALSGVRGIPRAKGTAARADGLATKFWRADAVEDIMTEAKGSRTAGAHGTV